MVLPKKQALLEDKNYFGSVINQCNTPIIFWNQLFKITKFNHAFEDLTGYKETEVLGKNLGLLFPQESKKDILVKIEQVLKSKRWEEVEIPILRKDNQIKFTLWNFASIFTEDSKSFITTIAHIQDTTKRKKIEDELRQSETMFKIAVDFSPLAIYLAEGVEQKSGYINPRFTELFGYTIKDVPTASHWYPLAYPDPKYRKAVVSEWKKRVVEAHKTGRSIEPMEAIATCKNGSQKHILWRFISIGQRNISYGQDLTEIKKAEEEQKRIDKAKSEFVALASHQLRAPLSAIKWYSKTLLSETTGKLTGKQKEYLEEIHRGNESMISLVNALLNTSRIEMGTFAIQPKIINIVDIYKEVIREVNEYITKKGLEVKEDFPQMLNISTDPDLIRIVFQNLITNAIKYTPEGGKIVVTISKNKTDLLLIVKDTGFGIPEKEREKIFTKLFRAANVTTKNAEGTGLGLYITKSIIEQAANGKIWFKSKDNKGTTFYVSLPLKGMKKRKGVVGLQRYTTPKKLTDLPVI